MKKIVDLSFPIHEGMTVFPVHWHPKVEINVLGRHEVEKRETRKVVFGTHTGTHVDAPQHFIPGGRTIDEIPIDILVGPALLLDFSYANPKQEMGIKDFKSQIGDKKPERILVRFDWSDHWGKSDYYPDHPFFSEEAAKWLVEKGIKLVGYDTPMPDNPKNGFHSDNDSPIHKIFLGKNVVLVEYLCNLNQLEGPEVELIVAPLRIVKGDGAAARCFAIEKERRSK
ncbi:cyclase [bacterium F11]|nr:cyclase [bacterium F11]